MITPALHVADWSAASPAERETLLARPRRAAIADIDDAVQEIARRVREGGNDVVAQLTRDHTGAQFESVEVSSGEIEVGAASLPPADRLALDTAIANVTRYHEAERHSPVAIETAAGVLCEQVVRAIETVGLYVPGGATPLPSTAIMLAVPARLAGCRRRIVCTPPRADGNCDPAVLYVARACGVAAVFRAGGAQAIAAMAFGTESVPRVDKI